MDSSVILIDKKNKSDFQRYKIKFKNKKFTLIDSPGFGKNMSNKDWLEEVKVFINDRVNIFYNAILVSALFSTKRRI